MSTIIRPEVVIVEEREKAEYNEHQAERRRIALALLPTIIGNECDFDEELDVDIALDYADLLIHRTEYKR